MTVSPAAATEVNILQRELRLTASTLLDHPSRWISMPWLLVSCDREPTITLFFLFWMEHELITPENDRT